MGLTVKRIARIKKPGRYGDGHGLCLQVTKTGVKSWLLRYERGGRERYLGLGPIHTIDLNEARERARRARQQLLDGIDPIETRRAERSTRALAVARTLTFEEATRQYFDTHEKKWRNAKHRAQFLSTLKTYAFPKMGQLPVAAIDTGLVLKVIEPIWHHKTETANRVRNRIEKVLDWASVRGYRSGDNPARWKGHLKEALPEREKIAKVQHHPALPFGELPEFLAALRTRDGIAARALEFLILTSARTGEVIGATADEFNLTERVWTVPAGRFKGGREHRVPLPERAVEILGALPNEKRNPFVFIGPRSGGLSNMALAAVLKRMGRDNITVHGFRSTFRDWAAERTNYPNHVVEMALAHVVGDKVEAAYRRGDLFEKRRIMMNAWAEYCTTGPTSSEAVIPMRRPLR